MSILASTDLLAVERSNIVYRETVGNKANIDATDLLLVERSNTVYRCTYSDWDGALGTAPPAQIDTTVSAFDFVPVYDTNTSGDSTADYSVLEMQVNVNGTSAGGNRTDYLFIGHKNQAATSYEGDIAIAHIQVVQSNGTTLRSNSHDWNFHNTDSDGTGSWYTSTDQVNAGSNDPADPASGRTWTTIGTTGTTARRWNRNTGTGSSYCGAADGIYGPSTYSGGGGTVLAPSATPQQTSSTYYLYGECSGSTTNDHWWLRTINKVQIYNGDYIRLAVGPAHGRSASTGSKAANTLWCHMGV